MTLVAAPESTIVRSLHWERSEEGRQALVWKEWLVTNGLGGYASGTVSGALTRRYHGLLIAAPTPFGRTMMCNFLRETLQYPDGRRVPLYAVLETPDGIEVDGSRYLTGFELEEGLPVWTYDVDGTQFQKRVLMPHLQNTTHMAYRLVAGGPVRLELRPFLAFRLHDAPVSHPVAAPYVVRALGDRFEIAPGGDLPPLRFFLYSSDTAFTLMPESVGPAAYGLEQRRAHGRPATRCGRSSPAITGSPTGAATR